MKIIVYLAALSIFAANALAQEEIPIPPEAKQLVDKLAEWELEKQIQLQTEVRAKREEVIKLLKNQLAQMTLAGSLDGAIAIRSTITRLEGTAIAGKKKTEPSAPPTTEKDFELTERELGKKKWISVDGQFPGGTLEFLRRGNMLVQHPDRPSPWNDWTYRIEDGALFVTPANNEEIKATLSDDAATLKLGIVGEFKREDKMKD